jgi:tetratricopeptide (TPR) repeat protein
MGVQPRLSAALIVRDAAAPLAETLESLRGVADEVVVVDTGSVDETPDVARQAGAIVHRRPWVNDFAQSRNDAFALCRGEWILWLDAGERLAAEAGAAVRDFVRTQANPRCVYMLLVTVPAGPGQVAGEQVGRIRLVPNRAELRFQGRVRESLRPAAEAAGMAVEGLPWRIERGQREHDAQLKLARAKRDLGLLQMEIRDHGRQPELLLALGETLSNLGDQAGGAAALGEAIRRSAPGTSQQRAAYYALLAAYEGRPDQRDVQLNVALEALAAFPLDAQLLCAMGGYLQAQGRLDLAGRSYQMAFEHGQIDPEVWHVGEIDQIAAICWSLALQLQQEDEPARRALEAALARDPAAERVRRQLIDLHVKHDRRQEALAQLDQLPATVPHREALRSAVRGACQAARQNWVPAVAYLQTAYGAGCRDPLCLRWLSVALVSLGQTAEAEPIVRQWLEVEPQSVEARQYLQAIEANVAGADLAPAAGERASRRIDTAGDRPGPALRPGVLAAEPLPGSGTLTPPAHT